VGSKASLDGRKILSPPGFDPRPSSPKSVVIPTELPGPHFNDSTKLKQYYKLYCEILSEVIIEAKNLSCNEQIMKPQNKAKTTWNIIEAETGNRGKNVEQINNSIFYPDALNNNFLTIAKQDFR